MTQWYPVLGRCLLLYTCRLDEHDAWILVHGGFIYDKSQRGSFFHISFKNKPSSLELSPPRSAYIYPNSIHSLVWYPHLSSVYMSLERGACLFKRLSDGMMMIALKENHTRVSWRYCCCWSRGQTFVHSDCRPRSPVCSVPSLEGYYLWLKLTLAWKVQRVINQI